MWRFVAVIRHILGAPSTAPGKKEQKFLKLKERLDIK